MEIPEREAMARAIVDGNSYMTLGTADVTGYRGRRRCGMRRLRTASSSGSRSRVPGTPGTSPCDPRSPSSSSTPPCRSALGRPRTWRLARRRSRPRATSTEAWPCSRRGRSPREDVSGRRATSGRLPAPPLPRPGVRAVRAVRAGRTAAVQPGVAAGRVHRRPDRCRGARVPACARRSRTSDGAPSESPRNRRVLQRWATAGL
jgi:hypothetical protein